MISRQPLLWVTPLGHPLSSVVYRAGTGNKPGGVDENRDIFQGQPTWMEQSWTRWVVSIAEIIVSGSQSMYLYVRRTDLMCLVIYTSFLASSVGDNFQSQCYSITWNHWKELDNERTLQSPQHATFLSLALTAHWRNSVFWARSLRKSTMDIET